MQLMAVTKNCKMNILYHTSHAHTHTHTHTQILQKTPQIKYMD